MPCILAPCMCTTPFNIFISSFIKCSCWKPIQDPNLRKFLFFRFWKNCAHKSNFVKKMKNEKIHRQRSWNKVHILLMRLKQRKERERERERPFYQLTARYVSRQTAEKKIAKNEWKRGHVWSVVNFYPDCCPTSVANCKKIVFSFTMWSKLKKISKF